MRSVVSLTCCAFLVSACATTTADQQGKDEPKHYVTGSNIKQRESSIGNSMTRGVSSEALKRAGVPELTPPPEGYRGAGN